MKHLLPLADSTDRAAWLEARKPVITATQITAIVGSNPYAGILDVWNEKRDPTWTEDRSPYLDNAAEYGRHAEASLIAWASTQPEVGGKLTANTTLFANPDHPDDACTPDAYRVSRRGGRERLVIVDAKTASKDWRAEGVPQYITDQMLWTWHVTGCDRLFLAVEYVKRNRRMEVTEVIDRFMVEVPLDAASRKRLDFLREQAAEFRRMMVEDEAPASILDVREAEFDADPETVREFAVVEAALARMAAIDAATAEHVTERAGLEAAVKAIAKRYAGKRVELVGTSGMVVLTRYWSAKVDYSGFDQRAIAEATSWVEQERATVKVAHPQPEPPLSAGAEWAEDRRG